MKKIVMYAVEWCGDCIAARFFFEERGIPYEEIDIERTPHAADIVIRLNNGMRKVPTLNVEGTIISGDKFNAVRFENDLRNAGAL